MTKQIEATHSDGDGNILLRINEQQYINLTKNEALSFMAQLADAILREYEDL